MVQETMTGDLRTTRADSYRRHDNSKYFTKRLAHRLTQGRGRVTPHLAAFASHTRLITGDVKQVRRK